MQKVKRWVEKLKEYLFKKIEVNDFFIWCHYENNKNISFFLGKKNPNYLNFS